jgi:hypothetical protein
MPAWRIRNPAESLDATATSAKRTSRSWQSSSTLALMEHRWRAVKILKTRGR